MKLATVGLALILIGCAHAQMQLPDQHEHWRLMVAEIDLGTLKIVRMTPANRIDYTHDECQALVNILMIESPDGLRMLNFMCSPKELVDTKGRL